MARRPSLYYITDRCQFPGDERARRRRLLEKIAEAARNGVDYIQLREKDLSTRELEELAQEAAHVVRRAVTPSMPQNSPSTRLLINSRTDIALAVQADGVHLRSEDVSSGDVRRVAQVVLSRDRDSEIGKSVARNLNHETRNFLVAVSCHSEQEVMAASAQQADFVVLAPIFQKVGFANAPAAGLDQLRRASTHEIRVFALGGVTLENAHSCLQAGAAGIAGIRLFQQNPIAEVMRRLQENRSQL